MRLLLPFLIALPVAAAAQDFTPLDDAGITQALNGQTVAFDGASQQFLSQGRTIYDNGDQTWGKWKVENGEYCSQWPPADGWSCYQVSRSGDELRFTGRSGTKDGRLSQ